MYEKIFIIDVTPFVSDWLQNQKSRNLHTKANTERALYHQ